MRIHVTIDDEDMQDRLGRAQRALEDERSLNGKLLEGEGAKANTAYIPDIPMPAPRKRRRRLSTNPAAVRARKARAAKK